MAFPVVRMLLVVDKVLSALAVCITSLRPPSPPLPLPLQNKASLAPEALSALVAQTATLKEWQERENSPEAIASLPVLAPEHLPREAPWVDVADSVLPFDGLPSERVHNGHDAATPHE